MAESKDNLTAVLHGKDDIRLEQRATPAPGPGQVQLQMNCVGICGSDVHYWKHGRCGVFVMHSPMVLGHEASGTVVSLGKDVANLKIGDRVAIEPGVPCRKCELCKIGRYNLCADMEFCATPPIDGNLRRFYNHAADFCFKLPKSVSLEEGAMLEPLSVGVHACRRAGVTAGSSVLICGAGPIGLVTLLTAKAMGASEVLITDIDESRLSVATALGATYVLKVDIQLTTEKLAEKVESLLGKQPDITVECSGAASSIQLGVFATRPGGVLTLVGMGPPEVKVNLGHAAVREVDIRGIFRYANCYPIALALISSGAINVKPLITHKFVLADTLKAYDTAATGAGNAIKVMIQADK